MKSIHWRRFMVTLVLLVSASAATRADWVPGDWSVTGGGSNSYLFAINKPAGDGVATLDTGFWYDPTGEKSWMTSSEPSYSSTGGVLSFSSSFRSTREKLRAKGEVRRMQGDGLYFSLCGSSSVEMPDLWMRFTLPLAYYSERPVSADDNLQGPYLFDKLVSLRATKIVLAEGSPGQFCIEAAAKCEWRMMRVDAGGRPSLAVYVNLLGDMGLAPGRPFFFTARLSARDTAPMPYCSVLFTPENATVKRYSTFEAGFQFLGLPVTNPYSFESLNLSAVFSDEMGNKVSVKPFYYQPFVEKGESEKPELKASGRPYFLVRFCPRNAGSFVGKLFAQAGEHSYTSEEMKFEVSDGDGGFVLVSPTDRRYFILSSGQAYVPVGLNLAWMKTSMPSEYSEAIKKLSDNGINCTRIWNCTWGINLTDGKAPWGLNQAQFYVMDEFLAKCREEGVYAILVLTNHEDLKNNIDKLPYFEPNGSAKATLDFFLSPAKETFRSHLSYIVNRFSSQSSLMAFELGNELDYVVDRAKLASWNSEMAELIRQTDINRHMVTSSLGFNMADAAFWRASNVDFTQFHGYSRDMAFIESDMEKSGLALASYAADNLEPLGRPALMAEFGYYVTDEQSGLNVIDVDGVHLQNGLWSSLFSGLAGTAMNWWWEGYVIKNGLLGRYKSVARFVTNIDFPHEAFVRGKEEVGGLTVLSLRGRTTQLFWFTAIENNWYDRFGRGKELVQHKGMIYVVSGLSKGLYRVEWWDTKTGVPLNSFESGVEDGRIELRVPEFSGDIALKITALRQ
ncbi:MAG: cellulase family glycosylhydrolase [Candidatus Brocadiia bacterium]